MMRVQAVPRNGVAVTSLIVCIGAGVAVSAGLRNPAPIFVGTLVSASSDLNQTYPAGSCDWLHRVAPRSMACPQGSLVPN
jgi:hypothetical protein